MQLLRTACFLLAVSSSARAQTADAPQLEEVLRQLPPDPRALDFLYIGTSGKSNPAQVYKVGAEIVPPRVVKAPDPEYPMKSYPQEGTVVLWVILGPDGKPRDIRVQRTLGSEFDKAAIAAVRKWRFKPALKDGVPVAVQINIEVNFRVGR